MFKCSTWMEIDGENRGIKKYKKVILMQIESMQLN